MVGAGVGAFARWVSSGRSCASISVCLAPTNRPGRDLPASWSGSLDDTKALQAWLLEDAPDTTALLTSESELNAFMNREFGRVNTAVSKPPRLSLLRSASQLCPSPNYLTTTIHSALGARRQAQRQGGPLCLQGRGPRHLQGPRPERGQDRRAVQLWVDRGGRQQRRLQGQGAEDAAGGCLPARERAGFEAAFVCVVV
jgi:hypothetical protein